MAGEKFITNSKTLWYMESCPKYIYMSCQFLKDLNILNYSLFFNINYIGPI